MASIDVNGTRIHFRLDGPDLGPVVMFSNSLATNLTMWDRQVPALVAAGYRVLRYDSRGQGRSEVPSGPYTMELLTRDAFELLDALDLERVSFCGCSKGGMVGQMLATCHGDRLESLILCGTAAHMPPPEMWDERIITVREQGMQALVGKAIAHWITASGRDRLCVTLDELRRGIVGTSVEGYCASAMAIRNMDQREAIRSINVPTLIVVGEHDPGTPVEAARSIHERIKRSELVVLPHSAHLANIEQAETFNQVVLDFLAAHVAT